METYFAPADRATTEELELDLARVSNNPVIDGLLHSVGGVLAVLNSSRQILAVNDSLLGALGIGDAKATFGLRPGEALQCTHAHETPRGCGTTRHCASCGAAIAIVASLENNVPVEKKCILRTQKNGEETDLCFLVRACPVSADGQRSLLHTELAELRPVMHAVDVAELLSEMQTLFATHSAAEGKTLCIEPLNADLSLHTDGSLLLRILSNMLTNAFEASEPGDTVRLRLETADGRLCFCVWNRKEIDDAVRLRIFQRYISTKEGVGRGTGTYTMKLFGETFLNGTVDFSSSAAEGTMFRLCLPISQTPGNKEQQP